MISRQISELQGSSTAKFFSLAKEREKQGHNIIHLEIGQPDFPPDKLIIESTVKALNEGKTTYTVSSGIHELREAISSSYFEDYGVNINPNTEIKLTSGAKQGLLGAFLTVLNRGDKIIFQEPYWVSYPDMAKLAGAIPITLHMKPDFSLNQELLLEQIQQPNVKALLLNSPNNPTGHILTQTELRFIKDMIEDYNIIIISDEIYNEYIYNDTNYRTLLRELKDWRESIIVINGFAKTYSMTGYRLGWTISNEVIAEGILTFLQTSTTCPTSFAQWGGITAINNRKLAREIIAEVFPRRRDILLKEVQKTEGLSITSIDGAFYGFLKYDFTSEPSQKVAEDILVNADVCVIPGTAFGNSAENYLRVTFSRSVEEIKEAFSRIRSYIDSK